MRWISPVIPDRIFFLGLALTIAALRLSAQGPPLEIRSGAGHRVQARTGSLLTLPVQFVNVSGRRLSVRPSAATPADWKRVASPLPMTLFPGGNDLQLLILSVPRNATVGSHPIVVTAEADNEPVPATYRFDVEIVRSVTIDAMLIDAPRIIVAGTSGTFVYEVVNRGNDTARVRVAARSSRGYEPELTPRALRLPPGASARVTGRVVADEGERLKATHLLEFTATLVPEGTEVLVTTASEIVPRAPSAELKRHEFPVFATLRATGESGATGIQAEIAGAGSLREDQSDRLEFLLRGPETQTISVLGLRDEYRARYEFGRTSLTVGDDTYALTPLTDVGKTATGFSARSRVGPVALGGYVSQTRYSPPVARQTAVWVDVPIAGSFEAGVNFLHRADRILSDIITLEAAGTAFRNARVEAEVGRSTGSEGPDVAYAIRLGGMEPWLSYSLQSVNAGGDYGGYYRGVRFNSLSLAGRTDRDVRLELTAREERRTPEADTLRNRFPRSSFVQMGVGYTNLLTLSYRITGSSDPVSASPVDRRQDVVELRSALTLGPAFLYASAELGVDRDRLSDVSGPTRRYVASMSIQPWPRQSYNLSVEADRSPDPVTQGPVERVSANLLASYFLFDRTQASASAFVSRQTGPNSQTYALLEASIDHVFPTNHRMRLHGRRSSITGTLPEWSLLAEYQVPLAVPLGTDASSGLVRGRVVERGTRGVPGAVVLLGAFATVTDDLGRFAFNDLAPGTYTLDLERASVGIDRITTQPLPLEVAVRGGASTNVTLSVIRGATVSGSIRLFRAATSGDSASAAMEEVTVSDAGLVSVELRNAAEVHRRVSDSRGRFTFSDVRPGRWSMKVFPLNLPADKAIDDPERDLDVSEGADLVLSLRAVPRRRTVRLIQQGGTLTPQQPEQAADEVVGGYLVRRASQGEGYVAQVSSWSSTGQAQTEVERIKPRASGFRVWIERRDLQHRGVFYRVLVGPFPSLEAARAWCRSAQ